MYYVVKYHRPFLSQITQFAVLVYTFKFVVYLNDKVMYYFKETFSTGEDELNPLQ